MKPLKVFLLSFIFSLSPQAVAAEAPLEVSAQEFASKEYLAFLDTLNPTLRSDFLSCMAKILQGKTRKPSNVFY